MNYLNNSVKDLSQTWTLILCPVISLAAIMANLSAEEQGPTDCSRGMAVCQEILLLWTVGINGLCHPGEFGGLIGEGGYTGIWMEVIIRYH